jgi:hypothetical protein
MSEKQAKDEILELIRLIERHKCKLFKWYDVFSGSAPIVISIIVLYAFVEPLLVFGGASDTDKLILALSLIAVVIALFSLLSSFVEGSIIRANYKRILKLNRDEGNKLEEDRKPLLKALVTIKAKNHEFDLKQIYSMNPSMFTREKLLERLYE